ncbi:DUF2782 domain-containing protein [Nitrosomonas sp. JL21]|uniref:DUF2782 domain-containing protein n=1 Tax=Nitrosomonas sp. JL21 TaxID=153949 RepID=UPI00136E5353|nr:DUF2782 domain-containing protein [Nitrosomonas sp. JL21]MBL8497544.1 DUF2782 domain-containing protein [Nitrosomonas sp.]MCC7091903.1 DUF2782 domain-containing protein [Nitrosomonas sp.]MXS78631.1 DUF2782 domain-containing protein [Nitrosomonas sp. JL21]
MHQLLIIMLLSYSMLAMAQSEQPTQQQKPSQPDNLIPLPDIPELPPLSDPSSTPPDIQSDPELETHVTIIKRGEDTIEEHRINGELLMIKVIPRIGPPYYLKKNTIADNPTHAGDAGINVSPPMWQLLKF